MKFADKIRNAAVLLERKRIHRYRQAVEAAAAGDLTQSFCKPNELEAIEECGAKEQNERLCDTYLEVTETPTRISDELITLRKSEFAEMLIPPVSKSLWQPSSTQFARPCRAFRRFGRPTFKTE